MNEDSAVMALNLYVQTQAFPKSTVRMLFPCSETWNLCKDSCSVSNPSTMAFKH